MDNAKDIEAREIYAQSINLVDKEGRLRAAFDVNDDGSVDLVFYHYKENQRHGGGRLSIEMSADGNPSIYLNNDKSRVSIRMPKDQDPTIELFNEQGRIWSSDD
ncbi:MAG: hypothetical protein AABO57_01190 [Acidobacteriota bacterium]